MAGEWLKFDASTPDKPEVLAITVAMGWDDPDLTVGKLLRVWRWFDQQTIDGNAPGVTAALLDRLLGVTGLCSAMAKVGWLSITEEGLRLPNFDRHNGKTAKDRALTAKRVAKHKGNAQTNDEGNAASVSGALPREEKNRDTSPSLRSGEEAGKPPRAPGRQKSEARTLAAYLAECRAAHAKPVPDDHHIRRWADEAGLQPEMLQIAWVQFRERYTEGEKGKGKRYKDWPGHFATAVKDNWFGLWYVGDRGAMCWTSTGLTHKTVLDARMAQQEADHAPA